MTIKSGKQCGNANRRIRDVSELKHWMIECNMGCSRQSLMTIAPVNDLYVSELIFVPKMDVFRTCIRFLPIYQVGGLQSVLVKHWCFLLTKLKSFVA